MNAKWHAQRMATERASLSVTVVLSFAFFLMGCTAEENVSQISLSGEGLAAVSPSSSKVIERDIEAPEVFQLTGLGVWDGRPSLGGVWVAHLSAPSAERVIVRNGKSGKFVIGALFRRNDVKDGVPFQISAAAAKVFGVSSGQQIKLNVTALRPHNVKAHDAGSGQIAQNDVIATAALDKAEVTGSEMRLRKPFIQLGIFNVEQNAKNTATKMRQVGIVPLIKEQFKDSKPFWRVVIGPANSLEERELLLKSVKSVGFQDAYAVTH
jgi:hypothetical protein